MRKGTTGIRGLLLGLICAACMTATCLPVRAEEQRVAAPAAGYSCIVRDRPNPEGADLGGLPEDTGIRVLGEEGDYYRIDCDGITGFVAKSQTAARQGQRYIHCDPASPETEALTYTPHDRALEIRHSLLNLARKQIGKPYIYGSDGPNGFDCSGLTSYLYASEDLQLSRRASLQMGDGIIVSREGLQVGDLLFFKTPEETALVSHVGIYVGDNQMIHAGSDGIRCVKLEGSYFEGCFLCARRIVYTQTGFGVREPVSAGGRKL